MFYEKLAALNSNAVSQFTGGLLSEDRYNEAINKTIEHLNNIIGLTGNAEKQELQNFKSLARGISGLCSRDEAASEINENNRQVERTGKLILDEAAAINDIATEQLRGEPVFNLEQDGIRIGRAVLSEISAHSFDSKEKVHEYGLALIGEGAGREYSEMRGRAKSIADNINESAKHYGIGEIIPETTVYRDLLLIRTPDIGRLRKAGHEIESVTIPVNVLASDNSFHTIEASGVRVKDDDDKSRVFILPEEWDRILKAGSPQCLYDDLIRSGPGGHDYVWGGMRDLSDAGYRTGVVNGVMDDNKRFDILMTVSREKKIDLNEIAAHLQRQINLQSGRVNADLSVSVWQLKKDLARVNDEIRRRNEKAFSLEQEQEKGVTLYAVIAADATKRDKNGIPPASVRAVYDDLASAEKAKFASLNHLPAGWIRKWTMVEVKTYDSTLSRQDIESMSRVTVGYNKNDVREGLFAPESMTFLKPGKTFKTPMDYKEEDVPLYHAAQRTRERRPMNIRGEER